jgi:cytoskeletal protein RodZ
MEDQPNYQPQDGSRGLPVVEPPKALPKPPKSSSKTLLITVVLVIVTALVSTGATWYYMDSQQKDQQTNNQKQVSQLTTQVKELRQTSQAKPTSTPIPTPTTSTTSTTKSELTSLYDFCIKDLDAFSKTERITYTDTANGKMATCKYEEKDGKTMGWQMIASYANNKWTKIWAGSDSIKMEQINCTKYKIPSTIYADCNTTN